MGFLYEPVFSSFEYMPRIVIAELYGKSELILSASPTCPSEKLRRFVFPPAVNESSCCSNSLLAFDVVGVPEFNHSNRCVVLQLILMNNCPNMIADATDVK